MQKYLLVVYLHTQFGLLCVFECLHTSSFGLRVEHDSCTMKSLSFTVLSIVLYLSKPVFVRLCLSGPLPLIPLFITSSAIYFLTVLPVL